MTNKTLLALACTSILLVGCSSAPSKRYSLDDDVAPEKPISVDHIEDAVPQYEPYSLGGNKDYTLRGNHYTIIKDITGFTEQGISSWYGKKFHGHLTSNGEIYDMYSMTAAHKTLPLPSYVEVTNQDNGKKAIVRVNDRGPFHPGRIIDLSYAAATKLDVIKTGTANVSIRVIKVDKPTEAHKQQALPKFVVQVASSQHSQRVQTLAQELGQKLAVESYVGSENDVHRVLLGPFNDYMQTQKTLEQVKTLGYSSAFIKSL
ncbi:lipoprotein [Vibrio variabilis]|uniref:Endolytic peptidoglycan transglycosylase RlpA n=1 Tax=Vibrio variabilis TaxID=990271 RepID=A0ABR4Y955_9VIBR|nr:septal ring lytic transglycosylase RlpA family protein [Vibrio variabilis]KHA60004.1 lipoprotein [Vibrio variabilis]